MLRQQEPGLAEGLCSPSSRGQSLLVTLTSSQQAGLSLLSALSLGCSTVEESAWTGLLAGYLQADLAWPQKKL